eukprot:4965240-Alexandrium_andersonii.AAC.1
MPLRIPRLQIHDMAIAFWEAGPMQRIVSLVGSGEGTELERYWRNALRLPWGQAHPGCAGT